MIRSELPCKKCKHKDKIKMVNYGEFTKFGEIQVPDCMIEVENEHECGNFEEI